RPDATTRLTTHEGSPFSYTTSRGLTQMDRIRSQVAEYPDDVLSLLELKNEFMELIVKGSGNSIAGEMLRNIQARVSSFRSKTLSTPGRVKETVKELAAITDAINNGDGPLASKLSKAHVQNAAAIALSYTPATHTSSSPGENT
ncbi:FCD domain-containing protein, partial [Pseudoglutamicibacter cumminsii]|uniref:FCD domain-containing protein n=1 Tax=Pseudoglutamicibacter cumminsii TaxID=156979 RepID=UPI002556D8D4